ncbi:hypothetical protein DPMN_056000 [Dreissena polymorpha]|uniref:Uncharacterized protein n=1 Tax=Dreissena polymorpha TaxID=45954 RepID=A0A9D4CRR5_DREPO|nr:hypothetical protein DPMN_056000 [Dreissena polymorpha]
MERLPPNSTNQLRHMQETDRGYHTPIISRTGSVKEVLKTYGDIIADQLKGGVIEKVDQQEAVINDRPLTYVTSGEPGQPETLTPAHLWKTNNVTSCRACDIASR